MFSVFSIKMSFVRRLFPDFLNTFEICLLIPPSAFILYWAIRRLMDFIPVGDMKNRVVFITGCDTGFGRLLALKCARNGIPVFAGCYTDQVSFLVQKNQLTSWNYLMKFRYVE